MFISGDLGGQWKYLKSEECSWSHLLATLDAWGVPLSCWNCPNPSECTMDMNECRRSDRMLKYLSPVRVVSRRIRGPISRQLHTSHTITEAPPD
ncbi:hypothetical protein AVEN_37668-1 [Araneus ventricosus]|uniref:Uncharacterized protein n=1 Tax=Araneus ventricosus TaxID=182803 RepID=A0A4Y2RRT4_ARAVE|nr:hypothetical protein AVEN_256265-1 [Araneus ventricosus]GBN78535.1 hypothetical protein AVEN_37668-1 [Araneus ventricosus]